LVDEEKKTTSENKKSANRILLDFHPQFLKAIRSVYPLGVLSSLSMTIAAFITSFGKDSLALAQTYAIAASIMFLFAFSCSLILKLFLAVDKSERRSSLGQYALFSYICTGAGIAFLFLVGAQFAYVLSVAKAILPIFAILFVGFILLSVLTVINATKNAKSKTISVLGYLTTVCLLLSVLCIISIVSFVLCGIVPPLPMLWGYLLLGSVCLGTASLFAMVILSLIQTHKNK
jgi:hypothetical protein